MITEEQYANHDCHLSADDGCSTCDQWDTQGGSPKPLTRAVELRDAAFKTLEAGLITFEDYATICLKNGVLIF